MQNIPRSALLTNPHIPEAKTNFDGLNLDIPVPHFSRLYVNSLHTFQGPKYPRSDPKPPYSSSNEPQ